LIILKASPIFFGHKNVVLDEVWFIVVLDPVLKKHSHAKYSHLAVRKMRSYKNLLRVG
jgi:hypothetical protein